jgi:hypothetical protein
MAAKEGCRLENRSAVVRAVRADVYAQEAIRHAEFRLKGTTMPQYECTTQRVSWPLSYVEM